MNPSLLPSDNRQIQVGLKKFSPEVLQAMSELSNGRTNQTTDSEARAISFWKRGNYFPLAGVSDQVEAVGDNGPKFEWIIIETKSGNTYVLDLHAIKDQTRTDYELIRVFDVRKGKSFDVDYREAEKLKLRVLVGEQLIFPNGANTTEISEISVLNGQWRG